MTSEITFYPNRQPALPEGEYSLKVTLEVTANASSISKTGTYTFTIAGEQFSLKPSDVQAVFPPAGSMGDHSDVLPHIILKRSSLPWERSAGVNLDGTPWLALLLFDEQDAPVPETVTLKQLSEEGLYTLLPGQNGNDSVTLIEVSADLLPDTQVLTCLAHVRLSAGEEAAVIIANRMPAQGRMSTMHLVSLEGRYDQNGLISAADKIKLISLYSWRFACLKGQPGFRELLEQLTVQTMRMPPLPQAEKYLEMGSVALPHVFRNGDYNYSWYHGPLIPGENTTPADRKPGLPVLSADQLLRKYPDIMMLDVSYAAAWELGRLQALQSKTFSTDLFKWKRANAIGQQRRQMPHLPGGEEQPENLTIPPSVAGWFHRIDTLEGIPLNYLAPDETLLKEKTISFFYVDWLWQACMRDGSYSIGRVSENDCRQDAQLMEKMNSGLPAQPVTGFLLRSEVVSGWPGLLVDGLDQHDQPLELLRMEHLSNDVLICLFKGVVASVDISLRPETTHFGLEGVEKRLDDGKGNAFGVRLADPHTRRITVERVSGTLNSALFASLMLQDTEKVRFVIGS